MKDDGDDWRDQKFAGHVTKTAPQEAHFVAWCPCGWERVLSLPEEARRAADKHERKVGRKSWFQI